MYAVGAEEPVSVVAFARVRPGEIGFSGVSRVEGLLPGVKTVAGRRGTKMSELGDWDRLLAEWHRNLDALGAAFARGEARVDPKVEAMTCRNCDQQVFCRIAEKRPWVNTAPEEDPDADA
jgi:hypothetical protein